MYKVIISLVFVLFTSFSHAQSNITISQAINLASKQSTLCERLTKEKILATTNPDDGANNSNLKLHLLQFEKNNSILKKVEFSPENKSRFNKIEMLLYGFKQNIKEKDIASAGKVLEFNTIISKECEAVFNDLLKYAKEKNEYPYNSSVENLADVYISANNIKFLSQKLASHYTAYYNKTVPYNSDIFNEIIEEIDVKINELTLAQNESKAILTQTNTLLIDWNSLVADIKTVTKSDFNDTESYPKYNSISNRCDALMKKADVLVRTYKQTNDTN